jgi:AAA+ superfamily predicted ATPase
MELKIKITEHPNKAAEKEFNQLIGIEKEKSKLLSSLTHLLDDKWIKEWLKIHHSNNLPIFEHVSSGTPLVVLEGDVGCGKTALAQSIGTILSNEVNKKIKVFETPSNIRGGGLVGEISNRITETFDQTKRNLKKDELGILIIDEADDIATSREQNQAHHEDRAGLNVLIKQLDLIKRDDKKLAVILITNRVGVLDPAVRRRSSLQLRFNRPTGSDLKDLLRYILTDVATSEKEVENLVNNLSKKEILYSFSDLVQRVTKDAIYNSIEKNIPFSLKSFKESLDQIMPSPRML